MGWFALAMAASGSLVLWLRFSPVALGPTLFCDWTADCSGLLWREAPFYLALLGLTAPTVPISLALHHRRIGSRYLGAAAIVTAGVALIALVIAVVATYDSMWSNYVGPFGLDVPRRPEVVPAHVRATAWVAWPPFAGVWMALTSIQLRRSGTPAAIAVIGLITGVVLVVLSPYAEEPFVFGTVVPLALILSLVWATAVGAYHTTAKPSTATA